MGCVEVRQWIIGCRVGCDCELFMTAHTRTFNARVFPVSENDGDDNDFNNEARDGDREHGHYYH